MLLIVIILVEEEVQEVRSPYVPQKTVKPWEQVTLSFPVIFIYLKNTFLVVRKYADTFPSSFQM